MENIKFQLTHPQKRIWYIEQIYPGTSLYNIGGTCRIKGAIDLILLEEAIHAFIAMNPGIRHRIFKQGAEVLQYIADYECTKLDFFDFSKNTDPEKDFQEWLDNEANKPFTLENERLFYFSLFKIAGDYHGYMIKFHHIISDGWSINIMTEQICSNYSKLIKGETIDLRPVHSYSEYIALEQNYLASDRFLRNKSFWNEKFKQLPEVFLNKSSDFIAGKRKTYQLAADLSQKIKEFAGQNKFSLNTFFTALFLLYLNKTTGQDDLVIGTPVLNRTGKAERSIFGMFTSTMPFRFQVDNDGDIGSTLYRVNEEIMRCYMNQKYPYDLLVGDLELKKKGYDNLFNVCINYYNTRLNTELDGATLTSVEFYNGSQIYSLQLVIKDWSDTGSLTLDFDYKVNDYTGKQIDCMYEHLLNLACRIIANPAGKTANLHLLSDQAADRVLYRFNARQADYPREKTIHALFEAQAARTPGRIAVSCRDEELTYSALNAKANQLARLLAKKGIKRESIAGLLTSHSTATVTGILAVLKAGGAYLPIDPGYPADRIGYMLNDSGAAVLLTNCGLPAKVDFRGEVIDLTDPDIYTGDASDLPQASCPRSLAYIIYTSGSTGRPKGTMIEHRALVNYIWWAKQMYVKGEDEVFPLYSSLAFDLTVTSLFTPLISGSRIIVYNDDEDEYVLYRIMKENRATVIKLTPSHLSLLKDRDNSDSSVRRFIVGGEDLKVSLAGATRESFRGSIEIYNEYGPTETTVGCMIYKYDYDRDYRASVPVGIPAHNVQIYILDKNLNPVPVGTLGEMYISGDGVGRGYINRPELTNERFVANPFIAGARMYRTGDLARFIDEETIEYSGRVDFQVKIRGYRIELGEIEKHLLSHASIKDAVVLDCEDKNQNKFLSAYIVKKAEITVPALRAFLLRSLPDYMVPLYFVELDTIPLNISGKVNRELLPAPETANKHLNDYKGFSNSREEQLVKTIMKVLQIKKIGLNDNFYHLGGDSIKAIQISSGLNDLGLKIKVKDILAHPMIEEMALCIQEDIPERIDQEHAAGTIAPAPIISWFFGQQFKNPAHYTQSLLLSISTGQDPDPGILEAVLAGIVKHHDALRINYDPAAGKLYYNDKHLDPHNILVIHDLSACPCTEQILKMRALGEALKSGFDLEHGLLFRACLFKLGAAGTRLLLTAHHLVIDAVSWRIILEDLQNAFKTAQAGGVFKLPLKTSAYGNWAQALAASAGKITREEQEYWQYAGTCGYSLEPDYDLGRDAIADCSTAFIQLPEKETGALLSGANRAYNTETRDLLIASLVAAARAFTGKDKIAIELEGHGREEAAEGVNITRTVGWFTSLYPVVFEVKGDAVHQQITAVKEQMRKIPGNGRAYGLIVHPAGPAGNVMRRYVRFNYLGSFNGITGSDFFGISRENTGSDTGIDNHLTCLLDINAVIIGKNLEISVMYSRNKFRESTIQDFIHGWEVILKNMISHCTTRTQIDFTPSDFNTLDLSQEELDMLFN